ncbi:unnamed protein product [Cochlearia groenlandica]
MKFLSWMHTLKQNVLNPSKEFKGVCCLRPHVSSQVQDFRINSFSFSGPSHDTNLYGVKEELTFDEDDFNGFLSIGTLGIDPETPKFARTVADSTVVQKEVESLITEKLDKFLEEYLEDTIYKRVETPSARDGESDVCTQQGYDLFRSSKELAERSNNEGNKKKGLLTSLFKGRQTLEEECSMKKHGTKDLVERMFKKLHGSSSKKRNDDNNDSISKKKDLRKSAQIFKSKVHPFLSTPSRNDTKIDESRSCINDCDLKAPSLSGRFLGLSFVSEANKKGEKWIKTDTEYIVLEL